MKTIGGMTTTITMTMMTMMTKRNTASAGSWQSRNAIQEKPPLRPQCPEPGQAAPETRYSQFRAMNTTVTVEGDGERVRAWFAEVEATLTRFDPNSPLSQLNRLQGRWVAVPPLLLQAIILSLQAAAATGGAFDPTVLDALEAAGYSRSFEDGQDPPGPPRPAGRWREVQVARATGAVWLPPGVRLDLGGIGKGLAVDRGLALLSRDSRALINAGGDLAFRAPPGGGDLLVEVEDPRDPSRTLAAFRLRRGAVATSSTLGRRWGQGLHHIIDPVTGRPAQSGIVAATVVAGTAVRAEVLAKACIVLGRSGALDLLRRHGCPGLLVTEEGQIIMTPGLEAYLCADA